MFKTRTSLFLTLAVFILILPLRTHAAGENVSDKEYLEKAKVTSASESTTSPVVGTSVNEQSQTLTISVLDGPDKGTSATFENDFTQVKSGAIVYVRHSVSAQNGPDLWSVSDPYRLNVLIGLALVFLVLVFLFGGIQGIRGLATLLGSLVLIFYVLLPGIYAGISPVLVSIGVASLIIIVGSYLTHGFRRSTTAAMLGMIATVLITGAGTYYVIHAAQLSGFTTESNAYLNFNTGGTIDMVGLLFGGIMIGLLGVLYDIAIGQAVAVEELVRAASHYTRRQVYRRALRIGREHIGALINTLAIAYVGASLPLLLLFRQSDVSIPYVINSELFATEIIRILMGSIGLILAVPITTLIASYFLTAKNIPSEPSGHTHTT
ncbi:MAG: hypothetical protein JWM39_58 [Parcubacteria group bacterium]|nr:hypothetical protein [Parcubacteria group bacterium]